ncbi:MAG: galactokinase, partial [Clostridium sp.]|nr:galactokinase [Clostridium sp.]
MEGTNLINKLKNKFNSVFGTMVDDVYFAPGRVNLIGEHTDYNG